MLLFAPAKVRNAMFAVCAFDLELGRISHSVSEPVLGEIRLQWWRDMIDAIFQGRTMIPHPVGSALADAVQRHGVTRPPLERMIDTRALELDESPLHSVDDLLSYIDGTRGQVTALCASISHSSGEHRVAVSEDAVAAIARASGMARLAMATAAGRGNSALLPCEMMREHGVTAAMMRSSDPPPGDGQLVRALAVQAEGQLEVVRQAWPKLPRELRVIWLEAAMARGYLQFLRRHKYDPVALRKTVVQRYRRQWWLLASAIRGKF